MVDFAKLLRDGPPPPPNVPGLIVGVTGHRPDKLCSAPGLHDGYDRRNPLREKVQARLREETAQLIFRYQAARVAAADAESIEEALKLDLGPLRETVKGDCHPAARVALREAEAHLARGPAEVARLRELARRAGVGDPTRAVHVNSYLRRVSWKGPMPDVVGVSGGALGIDQDACGVWYRMGVAYLLMLPFPGQEARWPRELQAVYRQLLNKAAGVIYVSEKAPKTDEEAAEMLKRRNEWVCGPSDELLAVWDGSRGGTSSCVNFWRRCGQHEILIDPRDLW